MSDPHVVPVPLFHCYRFVFFTVNIFFFTVNMLFFTVIILFFTVIILFFTVNFCAFSLLKPVHATMIARTPVHNSSKKRLMADPDLPRPLSGLFFFSSHFSANFFHTWLSVKQLP